MKLFCRSKTLMLTTHILIALTLGCQPASNFNSNSVEDDQQQDAPAVEEALSPTVDRENLNNGGGPIRYNPPPKTIKNITSNVDLILDRVTMDKTKMSYNKKKRKIKVTGLVHLFDENKKEIATTDFTLFGQHDADDNVFRLYSADQNSVADSSTKPVVRAKATCLSVNKKGNFDCSDVAIDFFIAYNKEVFTEQLEVHRPAKKQKNKNTNPTQSSTSPDDLQPEGDDDSIDGRYEGHASTADLEQIFSDDKAQPVKKEEPKKEEPKKEEPKKEEPKKEEPKKEEPKKEEPKKEEPKKEEPKKEEPKKEEPKKEEPKKEEPKKEEPKKEEPKKEEPKKEEPKKEEPKKEEPKKEEPKKEEPKKEEPKKEEPKKEEPKINTVQQTENGNLRPKNQAIGYPDNGSIRGATSILTTQQMLGIKAFFEVAHPTRNRHFGTYEMSEMIKRLGEMLNLKFLKKLFVGNISQKLGGKLHPHLSHQAGIDADFGYPASDNATKFPVVVQMSTRKYFVSNYSVEKTYHLLKFAFSQNDIPVARFFVDRTIKKALCEYAQSHGEFKSKDKNTVQDLFESIQHVDGHGDHFHIRLKCSRFDPACRNRTYSVNQGC